MAELKHTFTSGRMNKDLDDRLVPNGEYIDALNVKVASSEGSDVGAIENLLGNEQLSDLYSDDDNAVTLGSIAYTLKNKIYWFVTSDYKDTIYEYDQKTKEISIVLQDSKGTITTTLDQILLSSNSESELVIKNFEAYKLADILGVADIPTRIDEEILITNNVDITLDDPYVNISIPKNTVLKKEQDGNLEQIVFKNIIYDFPKLGNITPNITYTQSGILNFSKTNKITSINIIDDLLFWTDGLNPPRRIYIPKFKKYSLNNTSGDTQIEYKVKDPNGVIKILTAPFTEEDISVAKKAPMNAPDIEVLDSITGGLTAIQVSLNLFEKVAGNTIEIINLPQNPIWQKGDSVEIFSEETDIQIQATVVSITNDVSLSKKIILRVDTVEDTATDNSFPFEIELIQKKPLYELNFPRFAYRWKYDNGEYSTMSPFSIPAFFPGDFNYDGKEAFNNGMVNKAQKIILKNFDTGGKDIKEIDILFKETKNNNIYVYETKKKIDFDSSATPGTIEIKKEKIHSVIPNDQLLRAWDNVPKRAKAQEITANRIIYGNYYQNYDVYTEPDFKIGIEERIDGSNKTIKSDRNYQIGVVYIDEYNRHTPVLTGDNSSIKVEKKNAITKNKFNISLENEPPAWAKYFKYYIKNPSNEYYNLAVDRIYQDEENGFTYVSFPSGERNKITEEHYLILKKKHGADEFVAETTNRYKIIDIESDPPEFITNRKRIVLSLGDIVFTDDYSGGGGGNQITNISGAATAAPLKEYASIQIKQANASSNGVELTDSAQIKPGRYISFEYLGRDSKKYKIKRLSQHPEGDNEIKIDFEDPFKEDVERIYQKNGNLGDTTTNFGVSMNIWEEYSAAGDKEFDGRFFVKLKTNPTLSSAIVSQDVGGVSYLAKESVSLIGVYSRNEDSYRSNNGYENKARGRRKAHREATNPFVLSNGGLKTVGSTPETGQRIKKGSIEYHISFESATRFLNDEVLKLSKLAKVGNFVRFVNADGTPHHDTIYEIGNVLIDNHERGFGGTTSRTYKRIHFAFIDKDGDPIKFLDKDVCRRGQDTWGREPRMEILQEVDDDVQDYIKNPGIFETEPLQSKTDLDIYFETQKAYSIEEHGQTHSLDWYNAICFGNGVESNRIRDDFNATFIDLGVRASAPLAEQFKEEHKFNGLIWSGIINSRSGTNQSNQFNVANPITKDLLPSYGSIQKLFARDNDLVIYCEDKIVRALADKDILFNADGSSNVIASNRVIGNVIPFTGEYGISTLPESFASYGFRAYNADPKRGVIIRLSKDGITTISANYMNDFFDDRLKNNTVLYSSYDTSSGLYNITFDGLDTVCFDENVNGWVTRKSYIPENAISLNSTYYSYYNGELWEHGVASKPRNNFYGTQYNSNVQFTINDNPSTIKKFKTLGYEGTSGWIAKEIQTDQVTGAETSFKDKENKYFANITQSAKTISTLDQKNFSAQGIGRSVAAGADSYTSQLGNVSNTTATFNLNLIPATLKSTVVTKTQAPGENITSVAFKIFAPTGYTIKNTDFQGNNFTFEQVADNEILATISLDITHPTSDQTFTYNVTGKITKIPTKATGSYTISGSNFNFTGSKTGTYSVKGPLGIEKIINKRTITVSPGYFLQDSNFSINDTQIELQLNKISDSVYEIIESIFISNNRNNIDYIVSITPSEIIVLDKLIYSKSIDISTLPNTATQRILTVKGEENAEVNILFSGNVTGTITDVNIKLDNTNRKEIFLDFPAGNTAETFTILFKNLKGTKIDAGFGSNTVTISRVAKVRKNAVLAIIHSSTAQEFFEISDYINTANKRDFSIELTLPSGSYTISKQPTNADVDFGSNDNNADVSFNQMTFAASPNTNKVTVSGTLKIDDLIQDETYTLDISNLVGINVTTTFDYDNNSKDGSSSGNYTAVSTTYTVTGGAGLISTPSATEYFWVLTPASGYLFKDSIDADDFEFLDSGNNSVLNTFADSNELLLRKVNSTLEIGFKSQDFTQPATSQTFTIRPKNSTTLTETKPATSAPFVTLQIRFEGKLDDIDAAEFAIPSVLASQLNNNPTNLSNHTVNARATNLPHNTNFLFQAVIPVGVLKDYGVIDPNDFSDASKFRYTEVHGASKLAQPSGSATYNLFTANSSTQAITSKYSYNTTTHELTINILVNLQSDATSVMLKATIEGVLHSDKKYDGTTLVDKYHLVSAKSDVDCTHQPGNINENKKVYSTNDAANSSFPKYWVTDKTLADGSKIYRQESASMAKPGFLYGVGLPTQSFIVAGDKSLYNSNNGIITKKEICQIIKTNKSGIVTDPSGILTNGNDCFNGFTFFDIYNDVSVCDFNLKSDLYKDKFVKITGEWFADDYDNTKITQNYTMLNTSVPENDPINKPPTPSLTNYNIVKAQLLSEAGISSVFRDDKIVVISDPSGSTPGKLESTIYFDKNGHGTFHAESYRGKRGYRIYIKLTSVLDSQYNRTLQYYLKLGYSLQIAQQQAAGAVRHPLANQNPQLNLHNPPLYRPFLNVEGGLVQSPQNEGLDAQSGAYKIRQGSPFSYYTAGPTGPIVGTSSSYTDIKILAGPSTGRIVRALNRNAFDYSLNWPWQTKSKTTSVNPFGYLGIGSGSLVCGGRTSNFYNEERTNIKLTRSELLGGDGSAVEITKYWEYA